MVRCSSPLPRAAVPSRVPRLSDNEPSWKMHYFCLHWGRRPSWAYGVPDPLMVLLLPWNPWEETGVCGCSMRPCCGCTLHLLHQKHSLFTAHNWSIGLQIHFAELLFFFSLKCIKSTKQLSFYDSVISVVIQALDDQVLRGGGVWVSPPKCHLLCIRTFISNNVCSCCRKLLIFWPVSVVRISQHSPAMGLLSPIPCSWLFPGAGWEVGKPRNEPSTLSDFSEALGCLLCPHKPRSCINLGIQRDLWICLEIHMADLGWFRDATSCLCLYKHLH